MIRILPLLLLTAALGAADDDASAWHLRVTWTTDPARAATVSFDTRTEAADAVVLLSRRTHDDPGGYEQRVAPAATGRYRGDTELWYHHVRLEGLEPDTVYHFRLNADGQLSRDFHFRTLPAQAERLRFAQGGDSRTHRGVRQQVNDLIGRLNDDGQIDFLAHGGDYVDDGSRLPQWIEWLEDHGRTVGDDGRVLPLIVAQGNHERGSQPHSLYWRVFDVAEPGWFRMSVGGDLMAFFTLNTEVPTGGDQAAWLARELEAARAKHRWCYAQYHRPAFAVIKRPSGAMQDWVPVFERQGMDVVYECDGHNYKVLPPIRDGAFSSDGVVYLGEGGWGAPQRRNFVDAFWTKAPAFMVAIDHMMVIEVDRDAIRVVGLDADGQPFNRVAIPHERAARLESVAAQEILLEGAAR